MAREYNVIEAKLNSKVRKCIIGPLWQYDYGQILKITGIDLPEAYEVHFSNSLRGTAKPMPGDADGVKIPAEFLVTGQNVFAWFYVHNGLYDGTTEYQIEIQVRRRPMPTSYQPEDEDEKKIIEQLIEGQVKSVVGNIKEDVETNAENIKKLEDRLGSFTPSGFSEEDAIKIATETGLVRPVAAEDGSFYTDENGALYIV